MNELILFFTALVPILILAVLALRGWGKARLVAQLADGSGLIGLVLDAKGRVKYHTLPFEAWSKIPRAVLLELPHWSHLQGPWGDVSLEGGQVEFIVEGQTWELRIEALTQGSLALRFQPQTAPKVGALTSVTTGSPEASQDQHLEPLTKVWNRQRFFQEVQREISRSLRHRLPLSLILWDVDQRSEVQDEKLLQQVSQRIHNHLREFDLLSRWSGASFMVLAPHTSLAQARALSEKLRMLVASEPFEGGQSLTLSLGVSTFSSYLDLDAWIALVEGAQSRARGAGGNRTEVETN